MATVVFTDMEGSTALSSTRGDEEAMALLRVHEAAVRAAAGANRGRVVKSTGDGYLLAFDSSAEAVAAALAIRGLLEEHNASNHDQPVLVRMGVNTGPVIEEGGDLYGLAVNAAARVTAKASTGQVLVSDEVRRELEPVSERFGWLVVDRGLFWLKGLRTQWRLYEVTDRDPVQSPALAAGHRTPFLDRDVERVALRRVIDDAGDGRGGLLLLTGPSGSGKTRLLKEMSTEAEARGMRVLETRAHEHTAATPYSPVVELVATLERRLGGDDLREVLAESATEIARLVPHLRDRWPDIAEPPEWPVQEARSALFVAVRDTLARLAARRPLVIVIDDLHWADQPSLQLLEYLAGQVHALPIALLASYADDEAHGAPIFGTFVASVHRRRLAQAVGLGPLSEEHSAALVEALVGLPPPPRLASRLHEASGGNPFLLEEMVRHLADAGELLDGSGQWAPSAASLDLDVPASVRYTIEARLDGIDPATRRMLVVAAVIGRDLGFDILEAVTELDEDALLDALDEAERSHFLRSSDEGGGHVRFVFTHGLIRRILTEEISLTRRQRMHERIATALEAIYADELQDHASDIAFHLRSAGRWSDPARLVRFLLMAGDRALEAAAFDDALRHYDAALAAAANLGDEVRARTLEKMGSAERSLGHLDDALSLWDEALAVYDRLEARDDVARLCLVAAVQVAWWRRGREVMSLVERGLAALRDEDSPARAGLLALAGGVASQEGSYDQASRLLDDALVIARRHGDDSVLGLTLYSLAVHHFSYYQYENVVTIGRAAETHLRAAGDLWNLANVQGYVGTSLGWLGRFAEADRMGRGAEELSNRLGNWSAAVFAEGARAFTAVGSEPAAAVLERRGRAALESGESLRLGWLTALGHARMGLAAFWRGDWDDSLGLVERAARDERRSASGGHLGRLFLLHAYLGHRQETLELLEVASAEFPVIGRPNSGTSWTLALAAVEALFLIGEHERAAALYPTVLDHAATGTLMRSWDYRLVSTLAGIAAGCRGEWELSLAHFAHATSLAADLPMLHELPEVLRFEAETRLLRGTDEDVARAAALLADAAGRYEALGMARHASLAAERAASLSGVSPQPPPPAAAAARPARSD